jgi:hypothetical protein
MVKPNLKLAAIIILALFLRTVALESVPLWDWDEGANINYAQNLMLGKVQLFSYKYHFIPHPPLYFMALALPFRLLAADMLTIRLFSVVCSLLGLVFAYLTIRELLGEGSALWAALFYALFPELIFWSRMGFANNLLGLLVISSFYFLVRFVRTGQMRYLWYSGAITGLCPVTEYFGLAFVLFYLVVLYWHDKESLRLGLTLSLAPFIVFLALMLAFDGVGFLADAGNYFGLYPLALPGVIILAFAVRRFTPRIHRFFDSVYLGEGKETPAELAVWLILAILLAIPLEADGIYAGRLPIAFIALSVFGLMFIRDLVFRRAILTYVIGFGAVLIILNRWDHISIPLVFLLSLGAAFFIDKIRRYLGGNAQVLVAVLLLSLPFAIAFWTDLDAYAFKGVCSTPVSGFQALNGFVNDRTTPEDIVATFTYLAPDLNAKPTVLEDVIPYNGISFASMRRPYEKGEFTENLSVENLAYVVVPPQLVNAGGNTGYLYPMFGNWTPVYDYNELQATRNALGARILDLFGSSPGCEVDYAVYENPKLADNAYNH